ncbi:MAG TPA: hypothetical protein VHX59_03170 [Mycobacteriales bacterium]|nr:hypothetical protein [Mycobacteriales bacterium]
MGIPASTGELSAELRDTYGMYGAADGIDRVWLDESEFMQLSSADRFVY